MKRKTLKSKVKQHFLGTIQGVEIAQEELYYTTEWAMNEVLNTLDFVPSQELTRKFYQGIKSIYFKVGYFDFQDVEGEWNLAILDIDNFKRTLMYPSLEEAYEQLIKEYKESQQ